MATWTTTVDTLMRNFLGAVNASVPSMRAARILDEDLIGYDDWGRLCDVLFNLLVVEPLRSSRPKDKEGFFDIAAYETQYESYEDFSVIQVSPGKEKARVNSEAATFLFRFLPSDPSTRRFDTVETYQLDSELNLEETSWDSQSVESVYFTCLVPRDDGWELVDEVTVSLD